MQEITEYYCTAWSNVTSFTQSVNINEISILLKTDINKANANEKIDLEATLWYGENHNEIWQNRREEIQDRIEVNLLSPSAKNKANDIMAVVYTVRFLATTDSEEVIRAKQSKIMFIR